MRSRRPQKPPSLRRLWRLRVAAAGAGRSAMTAVDPLIDGMRALHEELFAAGATPATGPVRRSSRWHTATWSAAPQRAERAQGARRQPARAADRSLFPDDCRYVALGHLHRPQLLGGHASTCATRVRRSRCRCPSGCTRTTWSSVISTAMASTRSGRCARRAGRAEAHSRARRTRTRRRAAKVEALAPRDDELSTSRTCGRSSKSRCACRQPSPSIAERIARAIADKHARLVRVEVVLGRRPKSAPRPPRDLASLSAEEVFVRRYRRDFEGDVPRRCCRCVP